MYPTSEKKKESNDHGNVKNYLQQQRSKRAEKGRPRNNHAGGYMSNFTNYDDMKSESAKSYMTKSNRPVADVGLRKLLADPSISETERINAVKVRTEQIEQRAKMEE